MNTSERKASPAQVAVMQNLAMGRSPTAHLDSMSEFGGYRGTAASLRRNGWVDDGGFLTDAGRAALARATGKP